MEACAVTGVFKTPDQGAGQTREVPGSVRVARRRRGKGVAALLHDIFKHDRGSGSFIEAQESHREVGNPGLALNVVWRRVRIALR